MDLNDFFNKENDADYYLSEQKQRQIMYMTVKKMTKEELEDDLLSYVAMTNKAQEYIEKHRMMNERQTKRLWHILNFE